MSDITASERRLSAALDRMDQLLESHVFSAGDGAVTPDPERDDQHAAIRAENEKLKQEIEELRIGAGSGTSDPSNEAIDERLADAGEQAARLAAANDDLAAANRSLIDTAAGQGDADAVAVIREALEAEIEALRAARAAEISNLGDIIMELERLLPDDGNGAVTTPEKNSTTAATEGASAQDPQELFSRVYSEASDDVGLEDK